MLAWPSGGRPGPLVGAGPEGLAPRERGQLRIPVDILLMNGGGVGGLGAYLPP